MVLFVLTDEFVNIVGFIKSLSFWALYLTTTEVAPAPTPFVCVDFNFILTLSLFWSPWRVDPTDTVATPTLTVILSTLPFTCSKLLSSEYSKLSVGADLKNTKSPSFSVVIPIILSDIFCAKTLTALKLKLAEFVLIGVCLFTFDAAKVAFVEPLYIGLIVNVGLPLTTVLFITL